jgi:hypothetical protein
MQCPKCESDDVLSCSVAYEQGKSVIKTKGKSEGGDGGGRFTADHESTHTVLTEFAKRAAAPESTTNSLWYSLFAAVAAYFIVPSVWHDFTGHRPQWLNLLLLAGIAITIYRLVTGYKKRRSEDDGQRAVWERSWICKRCGTIFDPSEEAPGVSPAE